MGAIPTFLTEVSAAKDNHRSGRFMAQERQLLKSIDTHLASGVDTFANKTLTSPALNTPVLDGDTYGVASGTIANAAVKTLNVTPVTLVAAPGAGKMIVVDELQLMHDYATAAFDNVAGNEDFKLQYITGNVGICAIEATGMMDQTNDEWRFAKPSIYDVDATTAGGFVMDSADNEGIELTITTGEIFAAAGGGAVKYRVRYHVVDLLS